MTALERIEAVPIAMRHPAWRWNAALLVVADPNNNVDTAAVMETTDSYVSRAIKFCREKQNPVTSPRMYWARYADIYEAYLINMSANPNGGYKWQLEAMLMTGTDADTIAENYAFQGGADTVRAYAKLFFDIEPYREKELCVLGNVLSSSLAANIGIDDYDYSWKAFAYDRGYDNLLKFLRFRAGSRLPKALKKWFDEMTQDRVAYGAYSASANLRNMFNHQALQVLDVASKYYSVTHAILQNTPNDDNDASLAAKQILGALQDVILNPNIEQRVAENTDKHEPIIFSNPPVSN
jgi:hypothetical protein